MLISLFDGLLRVFALQLPGNSGTSGSFALQEVAAVLVHLQLGDHHIGRMDAHVHRGPVGLLTCDLVDVDHVFLPARTYKYR
jgi:hypothetical protein